MCFSNVGRQFLKSEGSREDHGVRAVAWSAALLLGPVVGEWRSKILRFKLKHKEIRHDKKRTINTAITKNCS